MDDPPTSMYALNGDVVGYSRLLADDKQATTERLADLQHLVEMEVAGGEGTLVNFVGDNFMAVFDSAMAAMQTAIAVTTEVEARNAARPG
jgi:class 3 adenylate cyclase